MSGHMWALEASFRLREVSARHKRLAGYAWSQEGDAEASVPWFRAALIQNFKENGIFTLDEPTLTIRVVKLDVHHGPKKLPEPG